MAVEDSGFDLVLFARERFDYDPETGALTWRDPGPNAFSSVKGYRIFKRLFVGHIAGSLKKSDGYIRICVDGKSFLAHRLIWALVYGEVPALDVDHADRDRANNKLSNLRLATRSQNCMNRTAHRTNKVGIKGVHWHRATGKWAACVRFDGQRKHLGVFDTIADAAAAYRAAASILHGEFAEVASKTKVNTAHNKNFGI
jgi:hypothetical protein